MLTFSGAPALSDFRLDKVLAAVRDRVAHVAVGRHPLPPFRRDLGAADGRRARRRRGAAALRPVDPDAGRRRTRGRVAAGRAALRHRVALVVQSHRHRPRLRPRRRRAHRARRRLLRRVPAQPLTRGRARSDRRGHPRPHDRERARFDRGRGGPVRAPCAAAARDRAGAGAGPGGARARQRRTRPRAVRRRDRLPGRRVHGAAAARPDRRRTDDVRAGQLRALPAQDLQCGLDRRRRAQREVAVRHDPQHAPRQPAGRALGLPRQRGRDRRLAWPPLVRAGRRRQLRGLATSRSTS